MGRIHALLYRLIQAARREPVIRVLRELERTQWWPAERLREEQMRKLHALLDIAQAVPHYRQAWGGPPESSGEIRCPADLQRLPILRKEQLRAGAAKLRNPQFDGPVNEQVTTGSSGVPLVVQRSRLSGAYGRAAKLRGHRWHGLRLGDREVRFGGVSIEALGRRRARMVDRLMNRTRLSTADLSPVRLADYIEIVRRRRPRYLYGYPSALTLFAAEAKRRGVGQEFGLELVLSSSERLFPHRREAIASTFGCPVADEYGAAEVSIIAMECPRGGLHQTAESQLLEIVDEDGRPVTEGDEGDVIVTDLNNHAAPLIRYALGDRARWVPGPCPCGRGLPRLEVLEGSSFGVVELPDGRVLSGVEFYFLSEALVIRPDAGLAEIVIHRRQDRFDVRVVKRGGGNPAHAGELQERLEHLLGPTATVTVTAVDRIERRGSDKRRILIEEDS
jgi:phenylacetate-CoA ligase